MTKIKILLQKLKVSIGLLFSKNYIVVVMAKKNIYTLASTESVAHLSELNDIVDLALDDAESFYDYENQNQL